MLGRRIRSVWILAAVLALFVMSACVPADSGAAQSGDMSSDEMSEPAAEGYPEEMIIGMGALPVTLVGNTVPIAAVPHLFQTALPHPGRPE